MLYGSISAATLDVARAASARTNVVTGSAGLSYGPGGDAVVAPGRMVGMDQVTVVLTPNLKELELCSLI